MPQIGLKHGQPARHARRGIPEVVNTSPGQPEGALRLADLTVDGSFPLGAALSAVLIAKGCNPILTLLIAFAAGAVAGTLTGLIHVKLKVRDLLSGIIMMTALYTVNLRIAGRANPPIYNMTTLTMILCIVFLKHRLPLFPM